MQEQHQTPECQEQQQEEELEHPLVTGETLRSNGVGLGFFVFQQHTWNYSSVTAVSMKGSITAILPIQINSDQPHGLCTSKPL